MLLLLLLLLLLIQAFVARPCWCCSTLLEAESVMGARMVLGVAMVFVRLVKG